MNEIPTNPNLETKIREVFNEVFAMQSEGTPIPELFPETILLETGLDSLGFAILVTRLEEDLSYDPFELSDEAFYPQTFQEFIKFYAENRP